MSGRAVTEGSRFRTGDDVRVSDRSPTHHVRTPGYVRGQRGKVLGVCGRFPDPERLAYGREAPAVWLYAVQFPLTDLWAGYAAGVRDAVRLDLYEQWLEPAEETA